MTITAVKFLFDGGRGIHLCTVVVMNLKLLFFNLRLVGSNVTPLGGCRKFLSFFTVFGPSAFFKLVGYVFINTVIATVLRSSSTAITVAVALTAANIVSIRATMTLILNRGVNAAIATLVTSVNNSVTTHHITYTRTVSGAVNILVVIYMFQICC